MAQPVRPPVSSKDDGTDKIKEFIQHNRPIEPAVIDDDEHSAQVIQGPESVAVVQPVEPLPEPEPAQPVRTVKRTGCPRCGNQHLASYGASGLNRCICGWSGVI